MKKKKEAAISGGIKNTEKFVSLAGGSDDLIKGKKQYASPEDLSPEDLKIYLASKEMQEELIACSSIDVDPKTLLLDELWNFTPYGDEPNEELVIGVLEPAAKRYPSLSIKTIGLIPDELYDDDFCDELKSVVESFINQKLEDDEEQ